MNLYTMAYAMILCTGSMLTAGNGQSKKPGDSTVTFAPRDNQQPPYNADSMLTAETQQSKTSEDLTVRVASRGNQKAPYSDPAIYPAQGTWPDWDVDPSTLAKEESDTARDKSIQETGEAVAKIRTQIISKLKIRIARYKNPDARAAFLKKLETNYDLEEWWIDIEDLALPDLSRYDDTRTNTDN